MNSIKNVFMPYLSERMFAILIISIMAGIANWLMSEEHTFLHFLKSVLLYSVIGLCAGQLFFDSKI